MPIAFLLTLSSGVLTLEGGGGQHRRAFIQAWLALAATRPSLASLTSLRLNYVELCKRGVYYNHAAAVDTGSSALLTMALAPRAWPKPCLHVGLAGDARLRAFRHELGLPEFAMFWKDDAILRFFMGQQRNVAAFVCGQVYLCLFCASIRSLLTLVHTSLHTSASAAGRRVADRMHTNI